jgi:FKBP-type peptidyl-prolyl cis-trans isomerase FkpA
MKKSMFFAGFALALALFSSACQKIESTAEVAARNEQELKDFIAKKGWNATKTPEGIYYVNDGGGVGSATPSATSTVTVKYKGYLIDETVFDQSSTGFTSSLQGVIAGWRIGLQKFQKGAKGKLLIPSAYAYGSSGAGSIPANSALIFDVELVDFK